MFLMVLVGVVNHWGPPDRTDVVRGVNYLDE
jgi:hypothetical protein